jgi:hypothetical protein
MRLIMNPQEPSLHFTHRLLPTAMDTLIPPSILRRPNHEHPFAPFIADDLGLVEKLFVEGFDPFWCDHHGMSCAMEAAARGHSASLHLALSLGSNPTALASLKSDSGLDAFDMAAAGDALACMWELSRHLPSTHRSSIGRGFMWHAVQARHANPPLADAWITDMLCSPSRIQPMDMAQALMLAREHNIERLSAILAKNKA